MNRNHIFDALDAGAVAVQMGTAFLTCLESGASSAHKKILLKQKNRSTLFTRSFSGRPARAIENEFIRLMSGKSVLDFPIQNKLSGPLRKVAARLDDPEYQSLWAGVNFDECRQETVSELFERLGFGD